MDDGCYDLAVVGLGSVGLATALAAAEGGLRVALIDPVPAQRIREGQFDGRDVAISNSSLRWLDRLGVTQQLASHERSTIKGARVLDRVTDGHLELGPAPGEDTIGAFVPEYRLRQLAFERLQGVPNCTLLLERKVVAVAQDDQRVALTLDDNTQVNARLLAAVDGRRSPMRGMLGIGASFTDYAMRMLCCRVEHSESNDGWTSQQFTGAGCQAILPLTEHSSSLALMMPESEGQALVDSPDNEFEQWVEAQLGERLGRVKLASSRFNVPLSSHYAAHFHQGRAVLLGDAAVGMLPITAHGLNLGLIGARSFTAEILAARGRGEALDSEAVLKRFSQRAHATARPLYLATNEICTLFRRNDPLSLMARRVLMKASGPFGTLVGMNCEQDDPRQVPWLGVLKALPEAFLSARLKG